MKWTKEEVEALNKHQKDNTVHPYTCDRNALECEVIKNSEKDGILVATEMGWVCPCGRYKQGWHDLTDNYLKSLK